MFATIRRLLLVACVALLIPCGPGSAEAGKSTSPMGMSDDMLLFLLDEGVSEKEIDWLLMEGLNDDDILFLYGLDEAEVYGVNGVSGHDLGSGRIWSFGETSGESPNNF